ncbi:MAG: (d)CMP kinase [Clostridia bacterium]|nr:(d)CMP kinase [Clostridia bacterium]
MPTSIAIDGPSGAGKSTLARRLAEELEYIYIDTGALYRTVGLHAVRKTGGYDNPAAVIESLKSIDIKMKLDDGKQVILLDGDPVGDNIRTPLISMAASAVSAIPAVRDFLMDFQRGVAAKNNVVMDGRDIGTVILPDAQVKIFLTASAEKRAARRCLELREKGQEVTHEQVLADMIARDRQDENRAQAPLRQAEDAVRVDTSTLDLAQSIEAVLRVIRDKLHK